MTQPTPLPALTDNYIWTLTDTADRMLVVDPGQAAPVIDHAQRSGATPAAVLLTHHHGDHIAGVAELAGHWPGLPVYAPDDARIGHATHRVADGDQVQVADWTLKVLAVPGHTSSHIAYHGHGLVFSGDALFSLGCGRLFEGTPAQMLASLDRLAALPGQTLVCCGHEYTRANAAFARAVEPDNAALLQYSQDIEHMHARQQPTLPSPLSRELACNPFLRIDAPGVRASLADRVAPDSGRVGYFAALRRWKDDFRG